jgi:ubiquitin-like-conjugating enzyme ATG10
LSRTALLQGCARNRDSGLSKDDVLEPEDIVEDPAVAHSTLSEPFTCGQSITFSPTFQVPVFYFTIHDSRAFSFAPKRRMFCSREVAQTVPRSRWKRS